MFEKIIQVIKNNKFIRVILTILIIVLIIITIFMVSVKPNKNLETTDYVSELESKLSSVLSNVEGAGKVSVAITVESGMETVVAMKKVTITNGSGTETTETPILVNGNVVVLKEKFPKIIGVLIVAEGAKNIAVLSKIQQATVSLLDINVNQIEVLTMN